jgi:hypothetical protein
MQLAWCTLSDALVGEYMTRQSRSSVVRGKVSQYYAHIFGSLVFLIVYIWTSTRGGFLWENAEVLFQSLGEEALTIEPLTSLLNSHIQPPGLNALFAVSYQSPFGFDRTLQVVYFMASLATVLLIADSLVRLRTRRGIAISTPVIFALLPTTTLYALWPYTTTLVAFFVAGALWGLSFYKSNSIFGLIIWSLGILGIFSLRSSFIWPLAIATLLLPLFFLQGKTKKILIVSAVGVVPILLMQLHYFTQFGLLTTSSWGGQSVVKGLISSGVIGQQDLLAAANGDPCLESIADELKFWNDINDLHKSCTGPDLANSGDALVLNKATKVDGQTIQFNSLQYLNLSQYWNSLAFQTLKNNPTAVPQMLLGTGALPSSLELSLTPGYFYLPITPNLPSGMPLLSITRPLGALFPVGALTVILLTVIASAQRSNRNLSHKMLFVTSCTLIGGNIALTSAVEYGENMRFLVEVYPALAIAGALSIAYLWPSRHSKKRSEPAVTA